MTRALIATALLLLLLPACNDSKDPIEEVALSGVPAAEHPHVPLRDHLGNHLTANAAEPYSPRETCGMCHDYNHIADGYHFQQGRTNSAGDIITKSDYFEDGRDHLQSPGMYGKW
ncbi:MAG: hypothetical protein ACYTGN_11790 [Planctomycetota bacterium]|jgi:hypothetical protein